jgi:sugar porter (SP) family MFS transporter
MADTNLNSGNRGYVALMALIVALGGFLMGFDASVISGVVGFIEPEFELTKLQLGWAVSCLTLTATLGMMISGPLSDALGRKRVLSLAAVVYAISAILSAIAPSFTFLVVARMIGGFGVGASLIVAPMYIAEISPARYRGQMVSFNQLNIVIGISAAFFSNYLILTLGQSEIAWAKALQFGPHSWRWMLGLETLPAVLYFACLFVVPESPRWLILRGRTDEALAVMEKAAGAPEARRQLEEVRDSIASETARQRTPLSELFVPAMRKVLLIGIVIAVIQQITGINAVFFYAPMIFEQSGLGTNAAFSQAVLVGLINLVFTFVAIGLVDKLGRKPLLAIGLLGITVSMLVLGGGFRSATYTLSAAAIETLPQSTEVTGLSELVDRTFESDVAFKRALAETLGPEQAGAVEADLVKQSINVNPRLILFGILGFVASFACSVGPVMWVLFSELFPNRVRGLAISFVGFINSAVSFGVQLVFPWELANLGSATTFLIYGGFAAVGFLFVLVVLPETKGRSLEELAQQLVKNHSSHSSRKPAT